MGNIKSLLISKYVLLKEELQKIHKRSKEGSKESNSRTKNRQRKDIRRTTEIQQNYKGKTKEEEQKTREQANLKTTTEGPQTDHKMTRQTTEGS